MKFKDGLALLIMMLIWVIWILDSSMSTLIQVEGEILGVTIAVFTLIAQYYFRKKGADDK